MSQVDCVYTEEGQNSGFAVVILGFAGAKAHHMEKYAQMWREKGYDTLTFTAQYAENDSLLLKSRRKVDDIVEPLRNILERKEIALHVFSMNGVWTLCSIDMNFPELRIFEKTKGILFDSCPIELGFATLREYFDVWGHAHTDDLKNGTFRVKTQLYCKAYNEISRLLVLYSKIAWMRSLGMDLTQWSAYEYLTKHPHKPKVQFFVFSENDKICHFPTTIDFAKEQQKSGCSVQLLHLLESAHVNHMRTHPRDYDAFVERFIDAIQPKAKL